MIEIREYMKKDVIRLPVTATIADAVHAVVERRVGTLPVVDEAGHLVGVVSLTQLLNLVLPVFIDLVDDIDFVHDFGAAEDIRSDKEVLRRPITRLMGAATSAPANCGLVRAYVLMIKLRLYDLPVVDEENRLVGLASRVDVARACLAAWETPLTTDTNT